MKSQAEMATTQEPAVNAVSADALNTTFFQASQKVAVECGPRPGYDEGLREALIRASKKGR